MRQTKRSLQESIILSNVLISIFPKMLAKKDKELYKFVREYTRENVSSVASAICEEAKVNLVKEVFSLLNQVWKNEPFLIDEGLHNKKAIYQRIRKDIEAQTGLKIPFNNREFYKRIRESIVHNDLENPNFSFYIDNLKLNLTDGYEITLTLEQFLDLIKVILSNVKDLNYRVRLSVNNVERISSFNDIKDNIMIVDENNNHIPLEEHQVACIYNFYKLNGIGNIIGNEHLLSKAFRQANNVKVLIYEKLDTAFLVSKLANGATFNQIREEDNIEIVNNYYALISNLLFTIVASQTNVESEEMLKECLPHFDKEEFRHLRNALAHGRYFHDYKDTFYFYDGKKELKLCVKLTIMDINRCLDKVAKGRYGIVIKK